MRAAAILNEVCSTLLSHSLDSDIRLRDTVTPHNALMFLWTYVLCRPNSKLRAAKRRRVEEHSDRRGAAEDPVDEEGEDEENETGMSVEEATTRLSEEDTGALRDSLHRAYHQASPYSASAVPSIESLKGSHWCRFG